MIIHHKEDFKQYKIFLCKSLKYSESFTFVPIMVRKEKFNKCIFQTPLLFTPFGNCSVSISVLKPYLYGLSTISFKIDSEFDTSFSIILFFILVLDIFNIATVHSLILHLHPPVNQVPKMRRSVKCQRTFVVV